MFYYISGKVAAAEAGLVVLDAGGVGYAINTSYPSARTVKVGEQALFYTFLRVAENIFELYGFVRRDELDCFKQLVTISGVGPRVALAILGTAGEGAEIERPDCVNISYPAFYGTLARLQA